MKTLAEIVATEGQPGSPIADIDLGSKGTPVDRSREANAEMSRMIEPNTLREAHHRMAHL